MKILVSAILFLLASSCVSLLWADSRPTRSECIIGYQLDWSAVKEDPYSVRRQMFNWPPPNEWPFAVAAMTMPSGNQYLYMQMKSNCENKSEEAKRLMLYWRENNIPLPEFFEIKEKIEPSIETIYGEGTYWSD